MILEIKRIFLDRVKEEAKTNQTEICGFIIGKIQGDRAVVTEMKQARNVLRSPVRFQIDPVDFLNTLEEAESKSLDVIGFYHSHPAPPYPSLLDKKSMALWPDKVWLIISTLSLPPPSSESSIKAFIKKADRFEEVNIVEK